MTEEQIETVLKLEQRGFHKTSDVYGVVTMAKVGRSSELYVEIGPDGIIDPDPNPDRHERISKS